MAAKKRQGLIVVGALAASVALTCRAVALSRLGALEGSSSLFFVSPPTTLRSSYNENAADAALTLAAPGGRHELAPRTNRERNQSASASRRRDDGSVVAAADVSDKEVTPTEKAQRLLALPAPEEERTVVFMTGQFASGFRNSAMAFTWFVMYAANNNYTSIALESLNWEDLFGRGVHPWSSVPHSILFDVEHWNSYFPALPRLISLNDSSSASLDSYGNYWDAYDEYMMYTERVASDPVRHPTSPIEIAMLRGAFRPSPEIRMYMEKLTGGRRYAALHARIEPDMQEHLYCPDLKVLRLSDIVRAVESHFSEPDFDRMFVATNRPLLEAEVNFENPDNDVAADNLRELNRIRSEGMWNGSVAVFEAGASYLRDIAKDSGPAASYYGIAGAVLDYFLALEATIFVGTEVSSFSTDLVQSRFYRSEFRNYHYRPDGLRVATTPQDALPPRFVC